MNSELKKTFWTDAAKAGSMLGLVLVLIAVMSYLTRAYPPVTAILSLLNFLALGGYIYVYAKKRAAKYEVFTYGQSMGFILAMMLFTGFIAGLETYVMSNYVDPELYARTIDMMLEAYGNSAAQLDMDLMRSMLTSPLWMVISGMMSMALYGGLIGLIASVFVKKQPLRYEK